MSRNGATSRSTPRAPEVPRHQTRFLTARSPTDRLLFCPLMASLPTSGWALTADGPQSGDDSWPPPTCASSPDRTRASCSCSKRACRCCSAAAATPSRVSPTRGISRADCEVELEAGQVMVTDLDSNGGTFVNGKRVSEHPAHRTGDVVQIGDTRLRVESPTADEARTLPPPEGPAHPAQGAGPGRGAPARAGRPHPVPLPGRRGHRPRPDGHRVPRPQLQGRPRGGPEGLPAAVVAEPRGDTAVRAGHEDHDAAAARQPGGHPRRRQDGAVLPGRHGAGRGPQPGRGDQTDRRRGNAGVARRPAHRRPPGPGAGIRPRAPGHPPQPHAEQRAGARDGVAQRAT